MPMTRTAVRRHVDVDDGRLVIRKIVVETSDCREVASVADAPAAVTPTSAEAASTPARVRVRRVRGLRPGKYAVRVRKTHLL
jgi:hypothetical protein